MSDCWIWGPHYGLVALDQRVAGGAEHHLPKLSARPVAPSPGGGRASSPLSAPAGHLFFLWGRARKLNLCKTMPVFMLLDVTHVFAYSVPVESLHFPGGILNVACGCSPCQRVKVTAGAALVQTLPRWVWSSSPNNPRHSLLPGVYLLSLMSPPLSSCPKLARASPARSGLSQNSAFRQSSPPTWQH